MLERITKRELIDLFIAWLGITIAFTLIRFPLTFIGKVDPSYFLYIFILSCLTVGIGFIFHEMAHKFTAMKYGYEAEFKKDNVMILMALVLAALVQVVFAAPGATVIRGGRMSEEQEGKISAAGPFVNLILCIPFGIMVLIPFFVTGYSKTILEIGVMGLQINAMIAAFNLLPISILDGKKVLRWSPAIFIVMIAISFAILFVSLTMVPSYISSIF